MHPYAPGSGHQLPISLNIHFLHSLNNKKGILHKTDEFMVDESEILSNTLFENDPDIKFSTHTN